MKLTPNPQPPTPKFEKNINPNRHYSTYFFFHSNALHLRCECALDG